MIDLYYAPTPNGWKITIMLEEASLPYNVIPVNLGKGDQFKPDFLKISPNNRMPAIVDHDGPEGKEISIKPKKIKTGSRIGISKGLEKMWNFSINPKDYF